MKVESLNKEEVILVFKKSKTKIEAMKYYGYSNGGGGRVFLKKVAKYFNLSLDDYFPRINKEKYNKNPKHCKFCGKILDYEHRTNDFCNKSCSTSYNNIGRYKSDETRAKISYALKKYNQTNELTDDLVKYISKYNPEVAVKKTCKYCGKIHYSKNDFCSHECMTKYLNDVKTKEWLNGKNFIKGNSQIPTFIRKYLFKEFDCKCEKCGWGERHPITGNIPLAIHHIDGDCKNNLRENLQLLCPNCHSLTNNFGSLNKNSKRFHRPVLTKNDIQ